MFVKKINALNVLFAATLGFSSCCLAAGSEKNIDVPPPPPFRPVPMPVYVPAPAPVPVSGQALFFTPAPAPELADNLDGGALRVWDQPEPPFSPFPPLESPLLSSSLSDLNVLDIGGLGELDDFLPPATDAGEFPYAQENPQSIEYGYIGAGSPDVSNIPVDFLGSDDLELEFLLPPSPISNNETIFPDQDLVAELVDDFPDLIFLTDAEFEQLLAEVWKDMALSPENM